jgi:Tetratricopeptide repeat
VWERLLADLQSADALAIGVAAYKADQHGVAEQAWRIAAQAGDHDAEYNLGVLLNQRGGVEEAEPWWRKAAAAGHPSAAFHLGILLNQHGRPEEAEPWWRKALELSAVALEIDGGDDGRPHSAIAEELQSWWPHMWTRDWSTLVEAKLNVVRRLGEATRQVVHQGRDKPTYLQLYRITCSEPFYPIRLAAAQEIGVGGDEAFDMLEGVLGPPGRHATPQTREPRNGNALEADAAPRRIEEGPEEERRWREAVVRAWLAPLLVGSVSKRRRDARKNLEQWLQFITSPDYERQDVDLRLSVEIALAQGFKYAANRRPSHHYPAASAYLLEQAREMLRRTPFWFSRLSLVQALCLWSLPDDSNGQQSNGGRDADPKAFVASWVALPAGRPEHPVAAWVRRVMTRLWRVPLRWQAPRYLADGRPEHPFVAETLQLARWALETRQPERFIWIDETSVVARDEPGPAASESRHKHNLWILPSAGWTTLHPRAQQLVADVLLLLNLAERGRPRDRNRRLRRTDRSDLPPCLAGDRSPLDPTRTVGTARRSEPGSNCKLGCPFELCPYPPKGQQSYRVELTEAFCHRQQALLEGQPLLRRTAPWQEALPGDLRRFWRLMGQRTQLSEATSQRRQ